MYPFIVSNVVLVKGVEAYGVYDLNNGLFYRITLEAGELLKMLDGKKHISSYSAEEKIFFEGVKSKQLLEYQTKCEYRKHTTLDTVFRENRSVKFAWIELTSKCNQKCLHCFMGNDLNRYNHVDTSEICSYIDILHLQGISQLILTGGEPTLHPEFEIILRHAAQYDMNISLLTNGTTNQLLEMLPLLRRYGVKSKISILGDECVHDNIVGVKGSYKKLMNTINRFIETQTPIELGMTVCSLNINDVDRVRKFANDKRIHLEISPIYPIGLAKDNYESLFQHTQRDFIDVCKKDKNQVIEDLVIFEPPIRCVRPIEPTDYESVNLKEYLTNSFECGQKIIAILASGKISPCLLLRKAPYIIGDLSMKKLEDILSYQSEQRQTFNKLMRLSNIEDCKNCEAVYVCKGGGCIAITESTYGGVNYKNPYYSECYYKGRDFVEM